MLRIAAIFLACFAIANPGLARAEKVALVISNWDYVSAQQLENPANDARLVAGALTKAGFDSVDLVENTTTVSLLDALRTFRDKAENAETALVYYAGHGIEGKGRNWLLPTDAALEKEADLSYEAVDLEYVMDALHGAQLRIAVLDACRNNPFANRWSGANRAIVRGLAPVEADDVLVIYAAAPGAVAFDGGGDNSPFARSLARRIVQPGLPVQMLGGLVRDDVLAATDGDQRPFISASITGQPVYLVNGPGTAGGDILAVAPPADQFTGSAQTDSQAWKAALGLDTVPGYRAYLKTHLRGAFAAMAQANIDQLLDPAAKGGKLNAEPPWLISIVSDLPDRYAISAGDTLPIDGIWHIAEDGKRLRIERGRGFAVDGWNHNLMVRIKPDQVTVRDIKRIAPGRYSAFDILLNAPSTMTLRKDGSLHVRFPENPAVRGFTLVADGLDNPDALKTETPR